MRDSIIAKLLTRGTYEWEEEIPGIHKFLDVQIQEDSLCLWYMVDPNATKVKKKFAIVGTGVPHSDNITKESYLGTVQHHHYVWHVFGL